MSKSFSGIGLYKISVLLSLGGSAQTLPNVVELSVQTTQHFVPQRPTHLGRRSTEIPLKLRRSGNDKQPDTARFSGQFL